MTRKLSVLVLVAAMIGGTIGLLAPAPSNAQARIDVDVAINPGGGLMSGSNGWLTCGWHIECISPYTYGDGLDWDNFDNGNVYWRSSGWRSDSFTGTVANAVLWTNNTGCSRIRMDVVDVFGIYRASEFYTHTTTPWDGHSNPISGGAGFSTNTEFLIGFSVAADLPGCPFFGSHVHQSSSGLTQNGYPSGAAHHTGVIQYPIAANGYWQHDVKWCWYC